MNIKTCKSILSCRFLDYAKQSLKSALVSIHPSMLTLQSSKSRIVFLLMFKVKRDIQCDDIVLTSQGVSFTEVLEGLKI